MLKEGCLRTSLEIRYLYQRVCVSPPLLFLLLPKETVWKYFDSYEILLNN